MLTTRQFCFRERKIKTLRDLWATFFQDNKDVLLRVYPGLNLQRFLKEVQDIAEKKIPNQIDLDEAEYVLSDSIIAEMKSLFLSGTPFPYILEKSEFYYNDFYVTPDVLIPRPETEYLVDLLVREFKGKTKNVLDIGTGSGVILLSLLYHGVGQRGVGADVSDDALKIAAVNRNHLGLDGSVELVKSDRLINIQGTFDLIVSNPPYIKAHAHLPLVHESVNKFEPHEALYLPDESYHSWFEDFFRQVKDHLHGAFFMEGHELELEKQAALLDELGFRKVAVLRDLTGTLRFLRAEFNP